MVRWLRALASQKAIKVQPGVLATQRCLQGCLELQIHEHSRIESVHAEGLVEMVVKRGGDVLRSGELAYDDDIGGSQGEDFCLFGGVEMRAAKHAGASVLEGRSLSEWGRSVR
ncbi:hypothetical protein AXZ07_12685 [Pseudomonas mosselii]|nr:hypothetical protein AXZ07_12685 [Pseudomonas mosselii]